MINYSQPAHRPLGLRHNPSLGQLTQHYGVPLTKWEPVVPNLGVLAAAAGGSALAFMSMARAQKTTKNVALGAVGTGLGLVAAYAAFVLIGNYKWGMARADVQIQP